MEQLRINPSPLPGAISVYGSQLASDLPARRAPIAELRDLRHHDAISCDTNCRVPGYVATRSHAGAEPPVHALAALFPLPAERRAA